MKVVVTREHWDRGVAEAYPILAKQIFGRKDDEPAYCETCVLAQAFKDAGVNHAVVNSTMATLDGKRYPLPKEAQHILKAFDRNETQVRQGYKFDDYRDPVFPIEFEITPL